MYAKWDHPPCSGICPNQVNLAGNEGAHMRYLLRPSRICVFKPFQSRITIRMFWSSHFLLYFTAFFFAHKSRIIRIANPVRWPLNFRSRQYMNEKQITLTC